jgi:hypothetical protein
LKKYTFKFGCMPWSHGIASVNFSHLIIGPGMLPCLCDRPIRFVSSRRTPCMSFIFRIKQPGPFQIYDISLQIMASNLKIWQKKNNSMKHYYQIFPYVWFFTFQCKATWHVLQYNIYHYYLFEEDWKWFLDFSYTNVHYCEKHTISFTGIVWE